MLNMFRQICGCTLSCETVTRYSKYPIIRRQITPAKNISKRNSSSDVMLRAGIKEYDHPREIIVDLSRSIYREIHNLFNPRLATKRFWERPGNQREIV